MVEARKVDLLLRGKLIDYLAGMAKLVDALGLGPSALGHGSSTLPPSTLKLFTWFKFTPPQL